MNPIQEFQKRAAAAGLTPEQVASYIEANGLEAKLASPTPADFFAAVVAEAHVEKTAESLAYAEGFLRQAADRGLPAAAAVQLSKSALASVFPKVEAEKTAAEKEAAAEEQAYVAGLYEKAAAYGLSKEQTTVFLQKAAAGEPGMLGKILRLAGAAGLGSAATIGAQKAPGLVQGADKALAAHYNPLNGLKDWLQANPELGGAIGGGAAGAGIGALSGIPGGPDSEGNPQENHVLRNTLLGTLAGGGAGAGAGHFAANPNMFKQLPA